MNPAGGKSRKGRRSFGLAAAVTVAACAGVFALSASSVARVFIPSPSAVDEEVVEAPKLGPEALSTLRFWAARGGSADALAFGSPVWSSGARISGLYGWRENPITGEGREFHEGLDIAAPKGAPVSAAREGRVTASYTDKGSGQTVEIAHADGTVTVYAHMSDRLVHGGESVARGETIGHVGYSGRATGPHLHFGMKKAGSYVDPMPFLSNEAIISIAKL